MKVLSIVALLALSVWVVSPPQAGALHSADWVERIEGHNRGLQQAPAGAITDTDILNFALNLEYLEAEFYSWAAFGHGLSEADRGGGPASIGGRKANLSPTAQVYADEIAYNEVNHVHFLRSALGSAAVPAPLIDIGPSFAAAANAALNTTLNPPFSPYDNSVFFYHGAFIFEDVGVTAYHGAAPLIQNKQYLDSAAGILGVEAYHAGVIRLLLAQIADTIVVPYGKRVYQIVNAISNLRDAVSSKQGPVGTTDAPLITVATSGNRPTNLTLTPVDSNSIAFKRTPQQVLALVYLGSASKPGGFFPNGMNGNIK